jgi:predicted MFS family arabinose efflux permease
MMFLFVGRAMVAPALSALVSRKANLGQGLTLSTSQSFDSLARTVGPLTAGTVFEKISPAAPYILSALVMAAASLLAWAKRGEMLLPPGEESRPTGGSGVEREALAEGAAAGAAG